MQITWARSALAAPKVLRGQCPNESILIARLEPAWKKGLAACYLEPPNVCQEQSFDWFLGQQFRKEWEIMGENVSNALQGLELRNGQDHGACYTMLSGMI